MRGFAVGNMNTAVYPYKVRSTGHKLVLKVTTLLVVSKFMIILYFPKPSEKSNQVFGLETMMSGALKNLSAE
jgi:lipoprotein signal peptidase